MSISFSLATIVLLCAGTAPAQSNPPRRPARLHVLASDSLFASVNHNDAAAALRAWTTTLGRRRGFEFDTRIEMISSPSEAVSRLKNSSVDLLLLDTPHYSALEPTGLIEPIAAGSYRGKPGAYEYLLLVRGDASTASLRDLHQKRIALSSRSGALLASVWIETLLAADKLPPASAFFQSATSGFKPSACVLPLFFGRLDACIVDSGNFELLKELNPQLSRLKVIARSEPVIEGVLAFPVLPHPFRSDIIESLFELHLDPAGAQMVLLFKTGPLVRVTPAQLETVRNLWRRFQSLNRKPLGAPLPRAAAISGDLP